MWTLGFYDFRIMPYKIHFVYNSMQIYKEIHLFEPEQQTLC